MPSPKLTKGQAAKQKKATEDFHANPNKPTSAGSVRVPRSLANIDTRLSAMVDKALDIMDKVIAGDDIPRSQIDAAKWVIPQARDMKKVILDNRLQKLKLQIEELKANPPEYLPPPKELPKDLPDNVIDINKALTQHNSEWDEPDEFSYDEEEEILDDSKS